MTQLPTQGPAGGPPQPNVYTLLLIVANLALMVTIGVALWALMSESGYGLSFGQLFQPLTPGGPG